MRMVFIVASALLALLPFTQASRAASSPAVPPSILAAAKDWFHRFQSGNIDRSLLDSQINGQLTNTMISREEATLKKLGKPVKFTFDSSNELADGITGYNFVVAFHSKTIIEESIAFDPGGLLAGIDFRVMVPR